MKNVRTVALRYNGEEIRRDKEGRVSLTDMWRATGADPKRDVARWRALPGTRSIVRVCEQNLGISDVLIATRGVNGGTWAHPLIAISYAKHLSPEFHLWANKVIIGHLEDLAQQKSKRARKWERIGRSQSWIGGRERGIVVRNGLTDTLCER